MRCPVPGGAAHQGSQRLECVVACALPQVRGKQRRVAANATCHLDVPELEGLFAEDGERKFGAGVPM